MGFSAVHTAAGGGKVAPFFRFPALQYPPQLLSYLAERNIGVFSTDIDSFDFKMRKPEQVIDSVMRKLEKHGKGIILMHDFQRPTAQALPELLRQLKDGGYKVVHMVSRSPVGGRQFGPAQVFIDLNQRGLIVTGGGVADFGTDGFVPALARRFETMKARDQFITGAAPPNDN